MKIEWQDDDIQPGRRVGKVGRTEQWMIAYFADRPPAEAVRYALVSLSDGMIQAALSAEAMAHHLNASGDMPIEMLPGEGRVKGGRARAANMTPERRSEVASDAAKARWNGN